MASAANCELPAYTFAFIASNCISYLMRMKEARKVHGKAANTATKLSFQPKEKAITMEPTTPKMEIIGNAPFGPSNS